MAAAFTMATAMTLAVPAVFAGSAASAATAPVTVTTCDSQSPSTIANGSSLAAGGCLVSPDGQYQLVMQTDDNLVLYYHRTAGSSDVLWASNTDAGYAGAVATLETGILRVTAAGSNARLPWQSDAIPLTNAELVLQDDGNLVIYGVAPDGTRGSAFWATGTNGNRIKIGACTVPSAPSAVSDGSTMAEGGCMASPDQDYELVMQTDGNLVLYYVQGGAWDALWASNTADNPGNTMRLTEGDLIVSGQSTPPYESGSSALNSELALQNDGNLVIYAQSPGGYPYAAWATGTEGNRGDTLTTDETLAPGQYLQSPNGQYQLQMGTGGVLILAMMKHYPVAANPIGTYVCPIWSGPHSAYTTTSGYTTTPAPNSYALLQSDGNVVIYPPQNTSSAGATWSTGTNGKTYNGNVTAKVKVQTDGNLVFLSKTTGVVTSLGTNQNRGSFWCTGEVLQGANVKPSDLNPTNPNTSSGPKGSNYAQYITSLVGGDTYKLEMTTNCQLVLYGKTGATYWGSSQSHTTATSKYANCYAVLLQNGVVQIVYPNDGEGGDVEWHSAKPTAQPYTITTSGVFGPFYAFTPEWGQRGTSFFIANQAGNQVFPGKSQAEQYALKAAKALVKVVFKLGG